MPQFTRSYSEFKVHLSEVDALRSMAAQKERENAFGFRGEINALCRGAIVLLSSHVEAYVRDLGKLALEALYTKRIDRAGLVPRLFYHISKDVLDEMSDTTDHDRMADKVFSFLANDGGYWDKGGPFINEIPYERFNRGFSNPKFEKLCTYFNRFGYSDYKRDFRGILKAQSSITENMLDQLVQARNNIAHGDHAVTKTPAELDQMITIISACCRTTDKVFADWWKTKYCSIR